ncbi:MAG: multidrug effflux MFS transporter [Propionibacteriaceae bacterium]|jgi:DHA1 family bicyclomycin/chloramphenicol resistance-like MFS transporter|nr:multidrug effflux MFS transporter [Propionibacteriaceae bacterium]
MARKVDVGPKWLFLLVLAGLGMFGPFAIDAVFPAFERMDAEWHVGNAALQQSVSVYLLSFAAMSLFHGPFSDALGRRPVIIVGVTGFGLASLLGALAPSLPVLLICRSLQGICAGAGQIVSRAMIPDVFEGEEAQRVMAQIAMIFGLAPAIAPIIGGYLLGWDGWRGVFWFLVLFAAVLLALVLCGAKETLPKQNRTRFDGRFLFVSLYKVWLNPTGRLLAFIGAIHFGGQFVLISSAPLFITDLVHLGETDFWVLFVPLFSGMIAGSWTTSHFNDERYRWRLAWTGYVCALTGVALLVGFAFFEPTAQLPWIVIPMPLYTFGISLVFPIQTLAMLELYPKYRGAASSVQSFISLLTNAVIVGLIAPAVAVSLETLMLTSAGFTVCSACLWTWYRRRARNAPASLPE